MFQFTEVCDQFEEMIDICAMHSRSQSSSSATGVGLGNENRANKFSLSELMIFPLTGRFVFCSTELTEKSCPIRLTRKDFNCANSEII